MGKNYSNYRWMMMILAALPSAVINCSQLQLSAYTAEFMADFSISLIEYAAVVTSYSIVTGVIGVFAGTLEDRFGVKRVVAISAVITTIASVVRLFTFNYVVFFIMSMLIGTFAGAGTSAIARISNSWFPEKERSLCVCIICMGGAVGITIAQFTAPLFAGYREAMTFSTVFSAVSTVAWIILGRDSENEGIKSTSIIKHLGKIAGLKNVWLIAAGSALFAAFMFGTTSLLPTALIVDKGMTNTEAVTATGMMNLSAIPGLVIMPILQRWVGKYRPILFLICGISAVCFASLFFVPNALVGVMIFIIGLTGGAIIGFYIATLANLREVPPEAMGSANGIVILAEYIIGSFFLSTYVLSPLMDINSSYLYVANVILCILMLVISALLPEVGEKSKEKRSLGDVR